jgi:peptidoglycan hydrolase-like protein with peptidoglycan-binding domain
MNHPTLRRGSSGDAVVELQELLNEHGYGLNPDGKFGAKTEEAVKDFQKQNGLVADGIVGDATWSTLIPDPAPEPTEDTVIMHRDELAAWRRELSDVIGKIDRKLEGEP